jgi:hypothetical protein
MTFTVLDPTDETKPQVRERTSRPESLAGLTVGLLDISKPRGNVFLDQVQNRLEALGATINRYSKPTFSKPAPPDLRHEIATHCDAVIEALAD